MRRLITTAVIAIALAVAYGRSVGNLSAEIMS